MRLDKYLADMSLGTRSTVKELIKKGHIRVNDQIVKNSDYQVRDNDEVFYDDQKINYLEYEYIMLNKPAGYLTATEDKYDKTVMELISSKRKDLSPVGRLDKDSEGLLLLTNDGELNHQLLSPKSHVNKKYYVELDSDLKDDAADILSKPIEFEDFTSKPAIYQKITNRSAYLTISEGKFHQVKRTFEKVGCIVTYLKRVGFGPLELNDLKTGESRYLSPKEIELLKNK